VSEAAGLGGSWIIIIIIFIFIFIFHFQFTLSKYLPPPIRTKYSYLFPLFLLYIFFDFFNFHFSPFCSTCTVFSPPPPPPPLPPLFPLFPPSPPPSHILLQISSIKPMYYPLQILWNSIYHPLIRSDTMIIYRAVRVTMIPVVHRTPSNRPQIRPENLAREPSSEEFSHDVGLSCAHSSC